jgi:hypothetical protein
LSWYIFDAAFIIANYLAKNELKGKGRDRGRHGLYHEMIQTLVTYEVVKVLHLYGLNPPMSEWIFDVAPEIYGYIKDLTSPGKEKSPLSQEVHVLLLKKTMHSGYFHKCNFAGAAEIAWKDDVKFMIPFLILTWLRQLQTFFDKRQKRTWSNYDPHLKLNQGDRSDPLAVVYLSMPGTGQSYKVKHLTDIQPNETYDKKDKNKSIVFTLLEEWAMLLLTPPVEHQLEQAINIDKETKE